MSPSRFGDWFFSIESRVASSGELGDDGTSLGYGVRPVSFVIYLLWGLIS